MANKRCSICKQTKSFEDFNKKTASKDGLQPHCRECGHSRFKVYYTLNKEKQKKTVKDRAARAKHTNREYIVEYLKTHPCLDCGCTDIRVLEFDHRPGVDKVLGVGQLAAYPVSLSKLVDEIEKCDVRCRNCHTIETYKRIGGSWHDSFILGL